MSKKFSIAYLVLFLGIQLPFSPQAVKAQTVSICPAQLPSLANAAIGNPILSRARWGILIQKLGGGTLYSYDAQKYFTPASNTKLLTTAAILSQFGANYRIRTSVYNTGDGVLRVVGRGDPSLTDAQLTLLAKQLKAKGVHNVRQLIADDSYFKGDIVNPSWQKEDIESDYGAPISSLTVNQNVFPLRVTPQTLGQPLQISWDDPQQAKQWQVVNETVTVGDNQSTFVNVTRDLKGYILRIQGQLSVGSTSEVINLPVVSPREYFLRRFRTALLREGVSVAQTYVMSSGNSNNQQELAAVESPPLSELLKQMNLESINLFAETFLKQLGTKKPLIANQDTADAGLEVLKSSLTQLKVDPKSYALVDGSGLSRKDLVSPEALVETLQAMAKSSQASVFRGSLPVAGVSGTLKNHFQNTSAQGIVQAKTGSMDGVFSLSGYVNAPNYGPVVFSIMINQSEQPVSVVRQGVEQIVVSLAQLHRC